MIKTKVLTPLTGALLALLSLICHTAKAQYIHPGGLHTQADLDRMKTQVAAGAHPWIDDWNVLIADPLAQNTYTAAANPNMGVSRQRADQDAHAAYLNAIRWYISGDTSYADCAVRILNAWAAAVNQVPTGTDIPGLIALPIEDFAIAAEVLRIYPGWSASNISAFKSMFTNYLYPAVNDFLTNHNGACISFYWPSWDSPNLDALIAMGVFNDNTDWFNQGVNYFENGGGSGAIDKAVFKVTGSLGQELEVGRDQEHAILGIGTYGYAAQIAWNQGVDLFSYSNNRLLAGAEYLAQYNLEKSVPYTTYNNCDNDLLLYPATNGRGRLDDRPVWELLYNHYVVKEGLSAPNVQAMAQLMRPEHGSNDHLGYGTLTFTLSGTASPYPPSPIPPAPHDLVATAGVGQVYLNWQPVSTANGYNVQRSTAGGGYTTVANLTQTTLPQYTDNTVEFGTTYSYEVEAVNQSGTSASSESSSATPTIAGALPPGEADADIGGVNTPGSAFYAPEGHGTVIVRGQGSGLGGTNDSFHFEYRKVTGDFTFKGRISNIVGAHLNNTGLMMRETLDGSSAAVTMVLGSVGGRIAEMGTRSSGGGSMNWVTGNKFTWLPVWFKLQRKGNTFTGYQSSDGVTWFTVGTSTVNMASTYYVGLAASSGDTAGNSTETTTFDNLSIDAPLVPGWWDIDIGSTGLSGSATEENGVFTVNGAGSDIWGQRDSFNYEFIALNGASSITARLVSLENVNYSKAGLMIRQGQGISDQYVYLYLTGGGGGTVQVRNTANAGNFVAWSTSSLNPPYWLRLTRAGNTFTSFISSDGVNWQTVNTVTVNMTSSVLGGFAVVSRNPSELSTAVFDNVTAQ